ncbi:hypothetical protein J5N97_014050 [Dioscorea zingiberensis]|uniref:TRF2/HOY1 PH-like domain-containing protein n=1 Tax=Dioscorea zingiberensis TaxID=325984 RepID=A0A9D5CRN4_9LILI|nr:hypothetical protein J5N97_014050 [Dioscorea zingiberensis]
MEQKKKRISVSKRAWRLLRAALVWVRKGGAFKRSLLLALKLSGARQHNRLHYFEREFSFNETPSFRLKLHRPRIPCINPPQAFYYSEDDQDSTAAINVFFNGCNADHDHDLIDQEDYYNIQEFKGQGEEDDIDDDEQVDHEQEIDSKAEEFIAKFYQEIKLQRQKRSTSDGETRVEAKFYYQKKQIVWEILDIALNKKRKIEIKFDDISGIKAFSQKGEAISTLIVQVKQAPLLWIEKEPEPMKHTIWMQETEDFTHGQVATNMIHELEFEEGRLEKHYDKLLRFDSRLHGISQNPTNISIHSERTQLAAVEEFLMNDQQQGDIDVGDEDATFLSFANELPDL